MAAIIKQHGIRLSQTANAIAQDIIDALDPLKASGRVRTLKDMSPEEIAALEAHYGAKVKR